MFTCARIQGYPTLPLQFFFSSFSHIDCTLYCKLAWEPRVVIVSPTIYPRFDINYDFSYFFPFKENPLNLESPWLFRVPQSKFRQIVPGFPELWSDRQTNRHPYRFILIILLQYSVCFWVLVKRKKNNIFF